VALGAPGAVLPILCRPASVADVVTLPEGIELVGWPTGAAHDVAGVPYGRTRAAAFMGKCMVERSMGHTWSWVSQLPHDAVDELPALLEGQAFRAEWGAAADDVTQVRPDETYPVRAATLFGVEEHVRSVSALEALAEGEPHLLGRLMAASQRGYDAMGLGHPAATAVVDEALARPGVLGARSSGGGCGGTVVVVSERGALDDVGTLIR
jgi:galactokinase